MSSGLRDDLGGPCSEMNNNSSARTGFFDYLHLHHKDHDIFSIVNDIHMIPNYCAILAAFFSISFLPPNAFWLVPMVGLYVVLGSACIFFFFISWMEARPSTVS